MPRLRFHDIDGRRRIAPAQSFIDCQNRDAAVVLQVNDRNRQALDAAVADKATMDARAALDGAIAAQIAIASDMRRDDYSRLQAANRANRLRHGMEAA